MVTLHLSRHITPVLSNVRLFYNFLYMHDLDLPRFITDRSKDSPTLRLRLSVQLVHSVHCQGCELRSTHNRMNIYLPMRYVNTVHP